MCSPHSGGGKPECSPPPVSLVGSSESARRQCSAGLVRELDYQPRDFLPLLSSCSSANHLGVSTVFDTVHNMSLTSQGVLK
jgi:hypothetical protein